MTNEEIQKDEQYMRRALDEARQALEEGEIPIGAVVVAKGRIISRAHNQTAAANALGGKYLTDCTLYVTVEPCPMCAGAIGWAQVPRIVYGAADEKRGYRRYAPNVLHPRANAIGGILEEECRQLMLDFFKSKR